MASTSTWALNTCTQHLHSPQFQGYRPAYLTEAHPLHENSNGDGATHREEGEVHQFLDFTRGSSLVVAVMNLRNSSPHVLRVIVHVQNVDEPSWFLRTCSENQVSCFGVSRLPAYRQQRYFRTLESAPNSPEVCGMRSWAFQNWLILGNHHMGGTWGLQPWEHDLPKSFGGSVASGFPAA